MGRGGRGVTLAGVGGGRGVTLAVFGAEAWGDSCQVRRKAWG